MKISLKIMDKGEKEKISKWKSDQFLSKKIMSNFQITSAKEAEKWIINNTSDRNQRLLGIYINENGNDKLIGISRLMFIDFNNSNAELGIYIGDENYLNKDLGSKSLNQTLKVGFQKLKLHKIYLKVSKENIKAIKLYEKFNFKYEGCLKEHYLNDFKFEDVYYMSIFKNDFL